MRIPIKMFGALLFGVSPVMLSAQEWTQKDQSQYGVERSMGNITLQQDSPVGAGETGVCVQVSGRVGKALQGLFGKSSERKEKEFALAAAREAYEQGYNWVILSPLQATTGESSTSEQRWVTVGTTYGVGTITDHMAPRWFTKTATVRNWVMDCMALDDIAAYHLMFGNTEGLASDNPYKLYSVYDIDAALGPLVEGSGHRPLVRNRPHISIRRFQQPGQRERLTAQLSVMHDTENCIRAHVDTSLGDMEAAMKQANMEAIVECWVNLAPAAQSAGWTSFPLFKAAKEVERENSAYDVAGRSQPRQNLEFDAWLETRPDPYRWSGGQVALGGGSISGGNVYALVISDRQLTETEAMDAVVFHFAAALMDSRTRYFGVKRLEQPVAGREYGLQNALFHKAAEIRENGDSIHLFNIQPYADPQLAATDLYDVNAEKLRAYNQLGPQLIGSSFRPFQEPPGYRD